MAILNILQYPDPRLYKVAKPITVFDRSLEKLIADMAETMYAEPGVGLSATQVDHHIQLLLVDVSHTQNELRVFINPKIESKQGTQEMREGCLSVPNIYERVTRAQHIEVSAQDQTGTHFRLQAEGLLSVCIQHEMDHLLGKVFVDYLSPLKRNRIKHKILKQQQWVMA